MPRTYLPITRIIVPSASPIPFSLADIEDGDFVCYRIDRESGHILGQVVRAGSDYYVVGPLVFQAVPEYNLLATLRQVTDEAGLPPDYLGFAELTNTETGRELGGQQAAAFYIYCFPDGPTATAGFCKLLDAARVSLRELKKGLG